jgi:hypothetical protein
MNTRENARTVGKGLQPACVGKKATPHGSILGGVAAEKPIRLGDGTVFSPHDE